MKSKYNAHLQPKVLRGLRAVGKPVRSCELGVLLGIGQRNAQCILTKLEVGGWVASEGTQRKRYWYATDKPGFPRNRRGKSPASLANLAEGAGGANKGLQAMWEKRKLHPRPIATHPLDIAMGWLPRSTYRGFDDTNTTLQDVGQEPCALKSSQP